MDILESIILGVIQGLTEFLPVSSSGHLEIGKSLFGYNGTAEQSMTVSVVLHFATALSTIVVFRKDIWEIIEGLLQFKWNEKAQFSVKIILSMIPAAFVGIVFEEQIDQLFGGNLFFVGLMLVVTAVLLYFADKAKNTDKIVDVKSALIIGIAQAIAILPGISRSGATISTAVLLGIDKSKSARFSFLMVVPLILGKIAKDLLSDGFSFSGVSLSYLGIGFLSAFVTGIIACTWMIKLVKNSKLIYFSIYCALVGLIAIFYSWS